MKSKEYIIENHKSECLDGRDMSRLSQFLKEEDLPKIGVYLKEEYVGTHEVIPFTKENVLNQLEKDVAFGWNKAINRRGISSELMYYTVKFWNWVLEDGLEDFDEYGLYGKPMFKETAEKYGWKLD